MWKLGRRNSLEWYLVQSSIVGSIYPINIYILFILCNVWYFLLLKIYTYEPKYKFQFFHLLDNFDQLNFYVTKFLHLLNGDKNSKKNS